MWQSNMQEWWDIKWSLLHGLSEPPDVDLVDHHIQDNIYDGSDVEEQADYKTVIDCKTN